MAETTNNKNRKKLILQLRMVELNWQCFVTVKAILKPWSPGGLNHLLVLDTENPDQWITIDDPQPMENRLMEHFQQHFQQAHGSPFTIAPLAPLLDYHSLTPYAELILQGNAPLNPELDPATSLLLKHHQHVTPPTFDPHHPLNYEELKNGFCKWLEWTSTSPSRCHLGIYKSLIKDVCNPKKKRRPQAFLATPTQPIQMMTL